MKRSDIFIRDPFVLAENGIYYLYGTRSETAFAKAAYGIDVYLSRDLENWEGPMECFHRPAGFWGTRNFWAPEVHAYGGKYFMFATFADDGKRQGTAILQADSPLGPFFPWSEGPITPDDWRCLDGTFYMDRSGIPYMVFCHEWKDVKDGTVCAVRLTEDVRRADGEPFVLFSASEGKPAIHPVFGKNYVTDGPFLFRTEDGRLHLLWSSFGRRRSYVQTLAHSDNDDIDGTWTVEQELLFSKDGGHGMIFRTFAGELMLTLHSPNRTGREHPVFEALVYENGKLRKQED